MRRPLLTTAVLIAFGLCAASAQNAPSQQDAAPAAEKGSNPSAQPQAPDENRKQSGTNDQAGPSGARPAPDTNSQGDRSTHSVSGRSGKEEPSSHAPTQDAAVFVDGKLNVPGAPADSQTVPAKFSERNDSIDRLPIMAMPLALSDDQRRAILASVKQANPPVQSTSAKPAEELPFGIEVHDLGVASDIPAAARLKVVRTADRVLLIDPSNRIVVGEIANK